MRRNGIAFLVVLLALIVIGSGCAGSGASRAGTGVPAGPTAKTSTAKQPIEGNHAERTYIDTNARLYQYKAVYIAPPTIDTTADRNEKVNDFLAQMDTTIRSTSEDSLRSTGKFELITTNEQEAKAKGRYLIYRNDVLVHFGSTAARVLIGMGAGRSKLIIVASLEDHATTDVLLKYTGWGGWAWGGLAMGWGAQALGKMQGDAVAIENYFAGLVKQLPS